MKTKLSLALLFAVFVTALAHAQTPGAPVAATITPDSIVGWLTPIIVPLILAAVKKILPSIPSAVIPLLAPVLGVVLDFANHLATGHASNWGVGIGLGLLGVAVREVKEAVLPAVNGGWPKGSDPTA